MIDNSLMCCCGHVLGKHFTTGLCSVCSCLVFLSEKYCDCGHLLEKHDERGYCSSCAFSGLPLRVCAAVLIVPRERNKGRIKKKNKHGQQLFG
jgi:hypothetical protein